MATTLEGLRRALPGSADGVPADLAATERVHVETVESCDQTSAIGAALPFSMLSEAA